MAERRTRNSRAHASSKRDEVAHTLTRLFAHAILVIALMAAVALAATPALGQGLVFGQADPVVIPDFEPFERRGPHATSSRHLADWRVRDPYDYYERDDVDRRERRLLQQQRRQRLIDRRERRLLQRERLLGREQRAIRRDAARAERRTDVLGEARARREERFGDPGRAETIRRRTEARIDRDRRARDRALRRAERRADDFLAPDTFAPSTSAGRPRPRGAYRYVPGEGLRPYR